VKRSDEMRDAVARFYDRISAGDAEGASATIANDPDAFVIGTQRIGGGRDAWIDSIRENTEMGIAFKPGSIRAWADGDSGWAVDDTEIALPNGVSFTTRTTFVAQRETDGTFRLVHMHASWAVPDEVAIEHAHEWRAQLGLSAAV
jgi:ketosteroid isomerase-like protein